MPIAINTSPPPSAGNTPNGPSTAPRTTATSRRGGRTRSRSPPVMGGRIGSGSPYPTAASVGENPSSAAAAAAAAAKAFSSGPGTRPHAAWSEQGRDDQGYHGYDKHYHQGPGSNWPATGEDSRSSYRYPSEYQGYPTSGYRDDRYHDARYRDAGMRDQYYDERGQPMPHHRSSRGPYQLNYRYTPGRDGHPASSGHRAGGGTSLVIGGPTPIHVPKLSTGDQVEHQRPERTESHASSRHSGRRGTADSVFRGRPGETAPIGPMVDAHGSPQKILLSLRTPSASFEDKDTAGEKKDGSLVLAHAEKTTDILIENRSPEDSKNSGSIETAPSFSLFNQSFDSFGDGHYFNVDSTLQNDSFGMGRIASVDPEAGTQILHTSSGHFSQQLLATNSGALTLGYSPVNSFGNVSAAGGQARRSGTTMVVGGADASNSPTQALVYRSYSNGGGPRTGPLDDSHLRMSVGSFGLGASSMPYSRSYAEGPSASPNYYYGSSRVHEASDDTPSFYTFLAKYKLAFKDCSFLLPGLKVALLESPRAGKEDTANEVTSSNAIKSMYGEPSLQDILIARRRIESSILAFGGNPHSRDTLHTKTSQETEKASIFRSTNDEADRTHSATITPGSTSSTSENHRAEMRPKSKYEEELPGRYYENESRLSWEFEETPPIEISQEKDDMDEEAEEADSSNKATSLSDGKDRDANDFEDEKGDNGEKRNPTPSSPQPKMRYRCKLCGQPKQNHTCPYQQSLARSIGIMVFPSVNSFIAHEPGTLAPPLTEMNNFFDAKEPGSNDSSPSRPTPDRMRTRMAPLGPISAVTQVTPESMRSSPRSQMHSPASSFAATPGRTPGRLGAPSRPMISSSRKRSYTMMNGPGEDRDLLFMESMELKVEQFRVVTPSKALNAPDSFCYPSLPLPYAQRKRLSDNLFALSNEVPKLTDECAQVLREAREKDMWDLAVAELMTQVIVIIHCPDGDARFEGLRQYLLTLGIAS